MTKKQPRTGSASRAKATRVGSFKRSGGYTSKTPIKKIIQHPPAASAGAGANPKSDKKAKRAAS